MDLLFLAPLLIGVALDLGVIIADQYSKGSKSCVDILLHEIYHLNAGEHG